MLTSDHPVIFIDDHTIFYCIRILTLQFTPLCMLLHCTIGSSSARSFSLLFFPVHSHPYITVCSWPFRAHFLPLVPDNSWWCCVDTDASTEPNSCWICSGQSCDCSFPLVAIKLQCISTFLTFFQRLKNQYDSQVQEVIMALLSFILWEIFSILLQDPNSWLYFVCNNTPNDHLHYWFSDQLWLDVLN